MTTLERFCWAVAVAALALAVREAAKSAPKPNPAALHRTDEMSAQPRSQPGPAKGLVTHVRPNPEYRRRSAPKVNLGFAATPPWQDEQ